MTVHVLNDEQAKVVTRAENQNITLKCRADARPPVISFGWYKNVSILELLLKLNNLYFRLILN